MLLPVGGAVLLPLLPGAQPAASTQRSTAPPPRRHTHGGGLEASRPSIRAALLAAALRALVAALRRQPLGRAALQQVQLDVHYLRPEVGGGAVMYCTVLHHRCSCRRAVPPLRTPRAVCAC